jgi:hypothetical protein
MASTINGTSTGNGGLISTGDDSGILNIQTNETTAITVDASQNVSVGTSTALITGSGRGNITVNGASDSILSFGIAGTNTGWLYSSSSGMELNSVGSKIISFTTNGSERMRIDSSGNLLVAKTVASETTAGFQVATNGVAVTTCNANAWVFYNNVASAYRFFVTAAGTINATNTTITGISDQRLKENIIDLPDGLNAVMALKPRKFDWKTGKGKNIRGDRGFIAQEFEAVFPDMIEEWLDPAPEGEEPYKGINANLIPTLVKAIQELKAINDTQAETINALTARIVALETA